MFRAALPRDPRVETLQMFGGIAAKVNGHLFAGLFGRSAMVLLGEPERADALALDGAAPFDPMGDGRARSDKVMLPEDVFHDPDELRQWIARAFEHCAALPRKTRAAVRKPTAAKRAPAKAAAREPAAAEQAMAKAARKPTAAPEPPAKLAKPPAMRATQRKSPAKSAARGPGSGRR